MGVPCYKCTDGPSPTCETFPTTSYLDIVATGQHYSKGPGYCPEGYIMNGSGYPSILDEQLCEAFGLSCDRW